MKTIVACVMSMGLGMALVGGYAMAKDPVKNVSAKKHPNIAAAQRHKKDLKKDEAAAKKTP